MKEMVLDIITSYESRILAVEEWMSNTYQLAAASDQAAGTLDKERARLTVSLQEKLAQNCSLRRKDFAGVMQNILAESEQKRRGIEEQQKQVVAKIKAYLYELKELNGSLRQQLCEPAASDKTDKDSLDTVVNSVRATCKDSGQQLLVMLRDFQSDLIAYRSGQEEINQKLQRLVDRGESLRIEDLRHLKSTKTLQDRKADRQSRKQEVERLLAHLKQNRENSQLWRQVKN